MPWASVAELRGSELYKRMKTLQKMGSGKLKVFLDIFNRTYERAIRGGAEPDEAESRAIAIALTGARNSDTAPANRKAEAEVAIFSLFAKDMMIAGGSADVNMKFAEIEDINEVMAGRMFYGPHSHDRELAEPQGIIHEVVKRASLSEDLRAKVDPDVLLVAKASFFDDIPQEERFATISPEWTTAKLSNGEEYHIPTSFITTDNPANDRVMGIGRVASNENDNALESETTVEGSRDTMPTVEELQTKVANLQKEVDASKDTSAKLKDAESKAKDFETKYANLEKNHQELVTKVASLAGKKEEEAKESSEDEAVKSLSDKFASLEKEVDLMKKAASQSEADAWADKLVKAKEVPLDSKKKFSSLYLANKQAALDIESTLPARVLQPGQTQANLEVEQVDEAKAADARKFLLEAF